MSALPSVLPSSYSSLYPLEAGFYAMTEDDLQQVMTIERLAYLWPWSEGNFIDSIRQGYRCSLLRKHCGQVLGYYVAMQGVEEVHLLNLTVAPEHQRQGWARVMLDGLHAWAREVGAQWVWLEVRVSNERAIRVYDQYGFRRVSVRKAYYPLDGSAREDALVMSRPA